ncbi:hypothetical protein ACFWU3_06585 [Streptomyces sp. NPDC058685]|uniref:hypothetical protein n=1 Tax=Streptomyces sp. NPDC058685 TaxID=3346598 RepID=UPI00364C97D3
MQQPLTCGGDTWGHGGDLEGFTVATSLTVGRRRSIVVVANGTGGDEQRLAAERAVRGLVDRALCAGAE